jgi:hypothetical protein
MLVIFHIKPHGKKQKLQTGYHQKNREQRAGSRNRSGKNSVQEQIKPRERTGGKRNQAQGVEKDQWVKVADHIFSNKPPEKTGDQ